MHLFSGEDPRGGGHARRARLKVVSSWDDYEAYFDDLAVREAREIM